MRILWFILLVSTVGFGRCGDTVGGQVTQAKDNHVEDNGQGVSRQELVMPSPDVVSKVDGNLFTTELGNDGGVPVLKLTAKTGVTAKKVTFDGKEVWSGGWISRFASSCSSAVLYFGPDNVPTLAIVMTKNSSGKETPKYRYHDGKKWQDGDATKHKTKLGELKNKHPPAPIDTQEEESPAPVEQSQDTLGKAPLETSSEVQDSLAGQPDDPSSENTPQNGPHNGESTELSKEDPLSPEETPKGTTQPASPQMKQEGHQVLAQPANPAAKDVKMDITDIDGNMFTIQESTDGKVPTKTLTPKDDIKPTEVTEGSSSIWKGGLNEHANRVLLYYDGGAPILATVTYTKPDGKASSRLYIKQDDGSWKWVEKVDYDAKLAELKGEEAATPATPSTGQSNVLIKQDGTTNTPEILDVKASSVQACRAFSININGVPAHVFVMNPGVTVNEVKGRDKEVWKHQFQDYCYYCIAYLKEDKNPVIILTMIDLGKERIKAYRMWKESTNVWELLSDNEVSAKVGALKPNGNAANTKNVKTTDGQENAGNATTLIKFTIDLSTDKDDDKCNVVTFERNGVTTRLYAPKDDHSIEKATEGGKAIFQLNESYSCYLLEYHSKGNTKLLRAHAGKDHGIWLCGYEKNGQEWKDIEEKVFNEKFKELVPATTTTSQPTPTPKK